VVTTAASTLSREQAVGRVGAPFWSCWPGSLLVGDFDNNGSGDVVVTQDYGLAAMCLARGAAVLNQDGMEYTSDNIDALLSARHTAKRIRNAGGRLKGPRSRTAEQNKTFEAALRALTAKSKQQAD
jgi:uncharacterized protein YaiI (UPF0178 family)